MPRRRGHRPNRSTCSVCSRTFDVPHDRGRMPEVCSLACRRARAAAQVEASRRRAVEREVARRLSAAVEALRSAA